MAGHVASQLVTASNKTGAFLCFLLEIIRLLEESSTTNHTSNYILLAVGFCRLVEVVTSLFAGLKT